MRALDYFVADELPLDSPWVSSGPIFNEGLVEELCCGPLSGTSDAEAAGGLIDLIQQELEAFGTSGGQRLVDSEIALAIRALEAVTGRLGRPCQLPFRDFIRFRSYWISQGASDNGGWQARRDILEELLNPARRWVTQLLGRPPSTLQMPEESLAGLRDPAAIFEHLGRIQRVVVDDPASAIGSAKEIVESTAKAVIIERGLPLNEKDDLPALVSQAQRALHLHPSQTVSGPDGSDAVKRILGGMITVVGGLAELRNRYGTGHGPAGARIGLRERHAHLAVNAAFAWCQLMLDTLADSEAPWRT